MSRYRKRLAAGIVFCGLLLVQPAMAAAAENPKCVLILLSSDTGREMNSRYFAQQLAIAEQLRQLAAKAGTEWLKTEELLLQSQVEANNTNWDTAYRLTYKACHQAELALQQAEYESQAWKHRVVE